MKLFLASQGLQSAYKNKFFSLLPKRNNPPKVAWIADAAEPYQAKGPTPWLDQSHQQLISYGLELVPIRLLDFVGKTKKLEELLKALDAVWISGGNTHYVRYAMAESGFDNVIKNLASNGLVYAGESAGAMVAAPNIELSEDSDDLKDVPTIIEEGLGLTDTLVLPHWDVEKYQDELKQIEQLHRAAGRKTVFLTNSEVLIVDN